jgi:hypothetical protein
MAWGVSIGFQEYAILCQDFLDDANRNQVWLYHSATGDVETLAFTSGEFDPNGRWLFLRKDQENDSESRYELWWREIEAASTTALPLASDQVFIHWTTGPGPSDLVHVSERLTVSSGNRVLTVSAEGEIQEQTVTGSIISTPLRSPDGHHLALVIRFVESGEDSFVVLTIE